MTDPAKHPQQGARLTSSAVTGGCGSDTEGSLFALLFSLLAAFHLDRHSLPHLVLQYIHPLVCLLIQQEV